MKFLIMVLVLASGFSAHADGGSTSAGPGHPSAYLCGKLGGHGLTIDLGGFGGAQNGICFFQDNSRIEQFTLWHNNEGRSTIAVEVFRKSSWTSRPGDVSTWAAQSCVENGGTVTAWTEHLRPSAVTEMCEFSDRSAMEIWTLFSGPTGSPTLAKLLK